MLKQKYWDLQVTISNNKHIHSAPEYIKSSVGKPNQRNRILAKIGQCKGKCVVQKWRSSRKVQGSFAEFSPEETVCHVALYLGTCLFQSMPEMLLLD